VTRDIVPLQKLPHILYSHLISSLDNLMMAYIQGRNMYTYLFTYFMVQSPSWEANWFAASQEIPRISRNRKVHYRTHKRPPIVSILGQPTPVYIPTSHLLEIHPNSIQPSTPRSPQWSPFLRFPHQDLIHPPLVSYILLLIVILLCSYIYIYILLLIVILLCSWLYVYIYIYIYILILL